ncbi:MAG: Jag N-terminal domain-containing protein [Chloroflexi bacterium]|nr:Jag N-terminal domain-containing protein [Chloroflexota bacterium]
MSEERTTLEIIAPTVEEAVAKGLADLGLPSEAVEVEVLDSGSRGLFGLGSRQARIRLTVKNQAELQSIAVGGENTHERSEASREENIPSAALEAVHAEEPEVPEGEDTSLRVARETVAELLEKMKVHAQVTSKYVQPEDPKDQASILIEVHGDDLSILIGRRSETLNALQYISSLIIGKELEKWVPLIIDVEGYRARRERQLRQLARRMAEQAVSTGRRQVLEPMPPSERRVIHLELRNHPQVFTESVGEEPNRKVTIVIKK